VADTDEKIIPDDEHESFKSTKFGVGLVDGQLNTFPPEEWPARKAIIDAMESSDTSKAEADYQNEPHEGEQCSGCSMFVAGLPSDEGGFCTKVYSWRGNPLGIIFPDGWCKYFASVAENESESAGMLDGVSDPDDLSDLDDEYDFEEGSSEEE